MRIFRWDRVLYYQRMPRRFAVVDCDGLAIVELEGAEAEEVRRFFEDLSRDGRFHLRGFVVDELPEVISRVAAEIPGLVEHADADSADVDPSSIYLASLTLEVNTLCPFRCPHCLLPVERRMEDVKIPPDVGARVVREVKERGAYSLAITGGEPSLYPVEWLREILTAADGMVVMMNTNGYGVGEELADLLAARRVRVKISVYGVDRESYARYTGVPDAYDRVVRAADLLRERGAIVWADFIYTRVHEAIGVTQEEALRFAKELGERARVMSRISEGWGDRPELMELSVDVDASAAGEELVDFHPRLRHVPGLGDPCALAHVPAPFVTAEGWVYACPFNDELIAHVDNPRWREIYYVKVHLANDLPWVGGRCAAKAYVAGRP